MFQFYFFFEFESFSENNLSIRPLTMSIAGGGRRRRRHSFDNFKMIFRWPPEINLWTIIRLLLCAAAGGTWSALFVQCLEKCKLIDIDSELKSETKQQHRQQQRHHCNRYQPIFLNMGRQLLLLVRIVYRLHSVWKPWKFQLSQHTHETQQW